MALDHGGDTRIPAPDIWAGHLLNHLEDAVETFDYQ